MPACAPTTRLWLGACLIAVWASAMAWAFWWYEGRYIRPFGDQPAFFYGQKLHLPESLRGAQRIHVVHFHNPRCPCEAATLDHLEQLIKRFAADEVSFYVLSSQAPSQALLERLPRLDTLQGAEHTPASPSVAIWAKNDQLAYFGPYSESAVCSSENSLVEPVLEALTQGRTPLINNQMSSGCLCPWPSSEA